MSFDIKCAFILTIAGWLDTSIKLTLERISFTKVVACIGKKIEVLVLERV